MDYTEEHRGLMPEKGLGGVAASEEPEAEDGNEPETAEPVKAWVLAYEELGLLNAVAESQEELVKRLNGLRLVAGRGWSNSRDLKPIDVLSNNPSKPETTTIWIDPLRVLAVLEQFVPRPAQPRGGLAIPPELQALLAGAAGTPAPEGDVAEVAVEPQPALGPRGEPGAKKWPSPAAFRPEPKDD